MFPLLCFCSMLFLCLFLKAIFLAWLFSQTSSQANLQSMKENDVLLKLYNWPDFSDFFEKNERNRRKGRKEKEKQEKCPRVFLYRLLEIASHLCFSWQPELGGATGSSGLQELRINTTLAFFGRVPGAGNSLGNNITILTFEPCVWKIVSNSLLIPENLR